MVLDISKTAKCQLFAMQICKFQFAIEKRRSLSPLDAFTIHQINTAV